MSFNFGSDNTSRIVKYTLGAILSSELSEIGLGILKFVSVGRGCLTFYFEWGGKCDYLLFHRPHDKSVTFLESNTGTWPRAPNDFSSKYDLRPWFSTLPAILTISPSLARFYILQCIFYTKAKLLSSQLWHEILTY